MDRALRVKHMTFVTSEHWNKFVTNLSLHWADMVTTQRSKRRTGWKRRNKLCPIHAAGNTPVNAAQYSAIVRLTTFDKPGGDKGEHGSTAFLLQERQKGLDLLRREDYSKDSKVDNHRYGEDV